jgi:hypothetical protein
MKHILMGARLSIIQYQFSCWHAHSGIEMETPCWEIGSPFEPPVCPPLILSLKKANCQVFLLPAMWQFARQ